jgi:hypothetical protein
MPRVECWRGVNAANLAMASSLIRQYPSLFQLASGPNASQGKRRAQLWWEGARAQYSGLDDPLYFSEHVLLDEKGSRAVLFSPEVTAIS